MKFYFVDGDMVDYFYFNQIGELYLIKVVDRDGDEIGIFINFINLVIWVIFLGYFIFDKYFIVLGI